MQTSIELAEGQTFAIAGLLHNSMTANKDVTPLLGDLPIVGDWDGNKTVTVGVYRPNISSFMLRNSNAKGDADVAVTYGVPGHRPVVGKWN